MELIDLLRNRTSDGILSFDLEIAYSTGRCKFRSIYFFSTEYKTLQWIADAERFQMDAIGHIRFGGGHRANKDLDRIEHYIEEVMEQEIPGDVYIDETMKILLDKVAEKENAYRKKYPNRHYTFTAIYRSQGLSEDTADDCVKTFEGFGP